MGYNETPLPKGTKMNDNQKIVLCAALTVTAVALSIKDYLKIRREERELRAKIQAYTEAEIEGMDLATERVIQRIREGKYDRGGWKAIMTDWKFETIIHHIDE